jgi:hypothetical protein
MRRRTDAAGDLKRVMPGLVPGIHVLHLRDQKDVDGRDLRAFTPVFDGLCPAMTALKPVAYDVPRIVKALRIRKTCGGELTPPT